MPKSKKKTTVLIIPILNDEYKVVFCCGSAKRVAKEMKSWGYDDAKISFDERRGFCAIKNGCHPFIGMPYFPRKAVEIASLAHEAVHAITDIFNKVSEGNRDEIFAHSVAAVMRAVLSYKKARIR